MTADEDKAVNNKKRIRVMKNGPYVVEGGIPLVHKTQVVSDQGEPLTWQHDGPLPGAKSKYLLCRCGKSTTFPLCDGIHRKIGFDGAETADDSTHEARRFSMPNATGITVMNDPYLCMESGFCGFADANFAQMVARTRDSKMRALLTAMIERCPSGSLSYRMDPQKPDIEPDLPQQIAATTEITADGPIDGPLWVTGSIPVERADGQPFETRNRVTLCNCGLSCKKPLCDGAHRKHAEEEAKRQREKDGK